MKTLLSVLPLWLAIASLVLPLTAQSVSKLELEKSTALNVWEKVTITPDLLSTTGELLVPTSGSQEFYRMKVRLLDSPAAAPTGFALIPTGSFSMGDALDNLRNAPTHTVNVSAFYMAQNLVTKAQWDSVRTWAISNGYNDLATGEGKASNHPVRNSWFQIVKWCNARSQQEGLTPVYYTNDAQTTVYKTGDLNLTSAQVKWTANGYRLPTEAEWEKAARGGLSGKRFPWGDTISHSQANYYGRYYDSNSDSYDLSSAVGNYHPTYATGSEPYTSPVGSFAANGYGLYDLAGNVWQWCWDWSGSYGVTLGDPKGAVSGQGEGRVARGGSWRDYAIYCRVANRYQHPPNSNAAAGFRVARSSVTESAETAAVDTQPASMSIYSGSTATLSVVAIGTAPLTYQWYQGSLGTTTTPVGSNSASLTTPALTATTTYWVRVSNATGNVSSALATVTVLAVTTSPGFAPIPAGAFTMGDALDGDSQAPTHTVNVSAFYMAQNLVTKADWDTVRTWATSNGYPDLAAGEGKASNHPVQTISWFDIVKWCNARSQQEGLTPVYYTNDAQTMVYKTGDVNVTNAQVKWAANGYRLPTEAEWEKAARGGLSGKRFPWGDTISQTQANYYAWAQYSYDLSGEEFYSPHPTYADGIVPYTSPVGSFAANGYGLNDMAGNVWQWCWDRYGTYDRGTPTDPRGVISGYTRVLRGGSWFDYALDCRVAFRYGLGPSFSINDMGFRVARSSVP